MELTVIIINPDRIVFEGTAEYVLAPGVKGNLGIFPTHTSMFAELTKGEIHVKGATEQSFALESGIMKVQNEVVTILISAEE